MNLRLVLKRFLNSGIGFLAILIFTATLIAHPVFSAFIRQETQVADQSSWITAEMSRRLDEAGENGAAVYSAIQSVTSSEEQAALQFLITNLQSIELTEVDAASLITDVRLACDARKEMPWGKNVPDEYFFNDVLPWFNVDEPREHWRAALYEKSKAIVADCKTPAEAAQRLNEKLFTELGVKYSTARKRANQCPSESIEQGLASCTGLSVLLVDACRSVCVPARLTGIPSWPNKRGNHTWVEIWDEQWHFTGAAEPSDQGLNHTWFQGDAALAVKGSRMNAIYSISFKPTDTEFPLVWDNQRGAKVYAVNVTDRYTNNSQTAAQDEGRVAARVRIWNHDKTARIVAGVSVTAAYQPQGADKLPTLTGKSTGDTADMNDMLEFSLTADSQYRLTITSDEQTSVFPIRTGSEPTQLIELSLPPPAGPELPAEQIAELTTAVADFFNVDAESRKEFPESLNGLLATHPDAVRNVVRDVYLKSSPAQKSKTDFDQNIVKFEDHVSPYTVKEVGERPDGGWPLVIAMHGGGGTRQEVNDSQWEHMQIYYKDHPETGGYKYLALRAPNNSWNGFYDLYVYPLIENLIRQMVTHGDVNPDRVMLIGYSHGGYGAFAIGPKIPYRFSAIHASASAPTDGQTTAKTLRNTRFTFMVGEKDTAYGRKDRCDKFAAEITELQSSIAQDCTGYPVQFLYQPGYGHGGLPDRDILPNLYAYQRVVTPVRLTWHQTDSVVNRHFWLEDASPANGKIVEAEVLNNKITIKISGVEEKDRQSATESVSVLADYRLIKTSPDEANPATTISLNINGEEHQAEFSPSLKLLCETVEDTGDIALSFSWKFPHN